MEKKLILKALYIFVHFDFPKRTAADTEVGWNVRVSDLAYPDNIILVVSNCDDVQAALNCVQAAAPGCGYDHKCIEDQSYAISG